MLTWVLFPSAVAAGDDDRWGIGQVLGGFSPVTIDCCSATAGPLPGGIWPEPTGPLVALALRASSNAEVLGALLLGINSRLRFDEQYLDYLKVVATQF